MNETAPVPQVPNVEASVVEYDRADGTHVAQQRFYEVAEDGSKHQIKKDDVAPQMETMFNSMAMVGAFPSTESKKSDTEAAPVLTPEGKVNYAGFTKFGEVFKREADKHAKKTANEVMDLAVTHEELFLKPTEELTAEDHTIYGELEDKYGSENVDAAENAAIAIANGNVARKSAEEKLEKLERMKHARGSGADTSDLDERIAQLNQAVERSKDVSESTRNAIYRQQVERHVRKESDDRLADPYKFWGFDEDEQAQRSSQGGGVVSNLPKPPKPPVRPDLPPPPTNPGEYAKTPEQLALDEQLVGLGKARNKYAKLTAQARRKSLKLRHAALVEQARVDYESQLNGVGANVAEALRTAGHNDEQIKDMSLKALGDEAKALAFQVGAEREALSGRRSRLAELWVKTGSKNGNFNLAGTALRALGMAGTGVAAAKGLGELFEGISTGVSYAASVVAPGLLGGRINHKRASSVMGKKGKVNITLADEQAVAEANGLLKQVERANQGDGFVQADAITNGVEAVTNRTRNRNALRIGGSALAGAIGNFAWAAAFGTTAGVRRGSGSGHEGGAGSTTTTSSTSTTEAVTSTTAAGGDRRRAYTADELKFIKGVNMLHDRYPQLHGTKFMEKVHKTAAYMLELDKKRRGL